MGTLKPVDGGYILNGQWDYCSGITYATHLLCGAMLDGEGGGRQVVVPRAAFEVLDDWGGDRTLGMRASGSNSARVRDVFVPEHMVVVLDWLGARPDGMENGTPGTRLHGNPMYLGRMMGPYHCSLVSVVVGAAWAALDEFETLMLRNRSIADPSLLWADHPDYLRPFGLALSMTEAAETILYGVAGRYMDLCRRWQRDRTPISVEDNLRLWAMAQQAGGLARQAVELLFQNSLSAPTKKGSKLARYFARCGDVQLAYLGAAKQSRDLSCARPLRPADRLPGVVGGTSAMPKLTDHTTYADAHRLFSTARLWELFDGNRECLNIGHECVDRYASPGRVALRIAHASGADETITFTDLSAWSSRFAHWLDATGVRPGDRVGIMLEPSLPFYAALFGAMKRGAVAVPLFTLFGPEGVRLRIHDCAPSLLLTTPEKAVELAALPGPRILAADHAFMAALEAFPDRYEPRTAATDMAIFQYTSGTTREMPDAIKHTHRAVVVVMNAALYGTGLRPGDRFFCPSSPAWGHGLWHGTLAPLALGIETGAYAGKFDAGASAESTAGLWHDEFVGGGDALSDDEKHRPHRGLSHAHCSKLSFTGEPIDQETLAFIQNCLRRAAVQHVRNHRGRRRSRQLSRRPGLRGSRTDRSAARFLASRSRCSGRTARAASRTSSARSRSAATAHGSRPRIAAAWMPTDISTMPAGPTT